jgi:3-methyladenine DNA glycosylase AlkC
MEPFKNLLGIQAAQKIATALENIHPDFSSQVYLKKMESELAPLELKPRMIHLASRIAEQLEPEAKNFKILVKALKQGENDKVGLSGFLVWPLTHFVSSHGLQDFDLSMNALKEMTKVFTAEFAVRPFFLEHEKEMIQLFHKWAKDENEHVRRLVSEGSRPLLPWGQKLPRFAADPELTWPLLEKLKHDSVRYVQKSVANHMNDLSKSNSDWLTKKLKGWPNPWVARHALRTLIKKGHPQALKLIGVDSVIPDIQQMRLKNNKIKMGHKLEIEFKAQNTKNKTMKVVADVEVHFLKKNGQFSPKVFKGKSFELAPKETKTIQILVPIKKVTTRTYYYGRQELKLMINGHRQNIIKFTLSK